jgi:hypothetical protein
MRNDARPIGEDSPESPLGGGHKPLQGKPRPGDRKDPKAETVKRAAEEDRESP